MKTPRQVHLEKLKQNKKIINEKMVSSEIDKELTDEELASEDWKYLFLITLTFLVFALGYIIESKLSEPIEYCTADFCIKQLMRQ